jgi:predicted Zn-dependent peptidase
MIAGSQPVSDAELRVARANYVQGYASGFETSSDLTGILQNLWISNLPMTAMQTDPDRIAQTPLSDVQAAASRFARLGQASLLLIGDRGKIEENVKSLRIGPIVLLNANGTPATPAP